MNTSAVVGPAIPALSSSSGSAWGSEGDRDASENSARDRAEYRTVTPLAWFDGSYVIIADSPRPHGTMDSAQRLPDLPFFGVIGAVTPGDGIDFYRLSLNSSTQALSLGLATTEASSEIPLQLQVFDGSGRLLAEWNAQPQGNSPLPFHLDDLPAGSTIYLGISAVGSHGAGSPSAIDYQLWVGLQPASSNEATARGATPATASTLSPAFALVPAALSGFATPPSTLAGVSQTPTTSASTAAGGSLVVGVPPQIRGARPSGGLLSPENPATDGKPEPPTSESRPFSEPSLASAAQETGAAVEPVAAGAVEKVGEDLVVLHGPGGFPLLGAVAVGHRRRFPGEARVMPTLPRTEDRPEPLMVQDSDPIPRASLAEAVPGSEEEASLSGAGAWGQFPFSVFSGFGLASVVTFNAVLSQPLAGFDYLTSRFDFGRSKSGRPRRRSRP
jgi:hypothetical protein